MLRKLQKVTVHIETIHINNETSFKLILITYSKPCLKRPLKNKQNKGLKDICYHNEDRKYCRMLSWSILQYF